MISENASSFNNKPVVDFEGTISPDKAYRIRIDYDSEVTFGSLIKQFCEDPNAQQVEEIILGNWFGDVSEPEESNFPVDALVENKDKLPNLKYIFLGDITYEECEISWIENADVNSIFKAYPELKYFKVRGGNGLSFGELKHDALETLIVETGGLGAGSIDELAKAELPNLKHFEIWTGDENYGWDGNINTFKPFFSKDKFPKLEYLGLCDCDITDQIAVALKDASVLDIISTLDLSRGTLGDEGAAALLANKKIENLKFLNLRFHYMSSKMTEKISALPVEVNVGDQQEEEEYGRYVEVSE
ncbi:STM4015 family protein [Fulvivirga maritima]|uniref:STM4015 family protein n=1 Tax=Fulvivirga maritima TaxID=2904247 RepID=UPI001F473D42|nr:STM4015 family protein [Fulvivirga maritima]UII27446.1 STM4015 family protein [Fulvivirga maritima]